MTRPEARSILSKLMDARETDNHGDYIYEHLEDVCDAVLFALGDMEYVKEHLND